MAGGKAVGEDVGGGGLDPVGGGIIASGRDEGPSGRIAGAEDRQREQQGEITINLKKGVWFAFVQGWKTKDASLARVMDWVLPP